MRLIGFFAQTDAELDHLVKTCTADLCTCPVAGTLESKTVGIWILLRVRQRIQPKRITHSRMIQQFLRWDEEEVICNDSTPCAACIVSVFCIRSIFRLDSLARFIGKCRRFCTVRIADKRCQDSRRTLVHNGNSQADLPQILDNFIVQETSSKNDIQRSFLFHNLLYRLLLQMVEHLGTNRDWNYNRRVDRRCPVSRTVHIEPRIQHFSSLLLISVLSRTFKEQFQVQTIQPLQLHHLLIGNTERKMHRRPVRLFILRHIGCMVKPKLYVLSHYSCTHCTGFQFSICIVSRCSIGTYRQSGSCHRVKQLQPLGQTFINDTRRICMAICHLFQNCFMCLKKL